MENISLKTQKITLVGVLLAVAIILSTMEHSLPAIPGLPPNTKIGLSNIIVMYTLFFMGTKYAYLMALLKSIFVMMIRGLVAGFISLSGGIVSVTFMAILGLIFSNKVSYIVPSIAGAIGHNLGQFLAASVEMKTNLIAYYWPFIIIVGIVFGTVTGLAFKVLIPPINKVSKLITKDKHSSL